MKKADCMAMPPLLLTENMIQAARGDIGEKVTHYAWNGNRYYRMSYQYAAYYKATVYKGVLKVGIWTRDAVLHNRKNPDYEIYCDKKEEKWRVYEPCTENWLTARVDNMKGIGIEGDSYGVRIWDRKTTRQVVNDYFGNLTNYNIREAVLRWQLDIRNKRLERSNRAELEEIDSVMNEVPELPKDFKSWSLSDALTGSHYMIYDKKAKKARCTYCDREVEIGKIRPKHNTKGKCPLCHKQVTFKAWGKQKTLEARRDTGIIQMLKDGRGYMARYLKNWESIWKSQSFSRRTSRESTRSLQGSVWKWKRKRCQQTSEGKTVC